MAFDPVAYSQSLDEALGYPGARRPQAGGGMGLMPGPTIGPSPPFTESGEGPWAEELGALKGGQPMTIDGAAAPGGVMQPGAPSPGGAPAPSGGAPGKIQGQPPFKLKYKDGALDKVKNTGDLLKAMTPASQRKYMDWWEGQYGAINERYNELQRQIGRRPDADGALSRKEQFRMLMEFGMELMARSGKGEQGAGGMAFAGSYDRARARKEGKAAEHDARSAQIEKYRGDELKAIGSYGDALKGQSDIDQNEVQMEEARARMKKAGRRDPEIITADQGTYDYDPETGESKPIVGIDGKPLTNMRVGARGGSAAGRDTRTANQKNIEDLTERGVPEQLAVDIVYRRISDPQKAWDALYRDRRRQYASEQEAKEETDRIISAGYGDDWQSRPKNARIDKTDPLGLRD